MPLTYFVTHAPTTKNATSNMSAASNTGHAHTISDAISHDTKTMNGSHIRI